MAGLLTRGLKGPASQLAKLALKSSAPACSTALVNLPQNRSLFHKSNRDPIDPDNLYEPWPYREKGYVYRHTAFPFYECTTKRLSDTSKLIIVEGNIGSGKSAVAQKIADDFDFHYIPAPTMDNFFINVYGSDLRNYYDLMPERYKLFDEKMFYEDPFHVNVANFQETMHDLKFEAYQNAIAHMLNTGQGVVLERSVLSDFVFVDAMYSKGCVSGDYMRYYRMLVEGTQHRLEFWPHLIVYLDCPAEQCLANIQKRGIDAEMNSEIMDLDYLLAIEKSYKKFFLRKWSDFSAILAYDWSTPGHPDLLVEDIENLELGDVKHDWHEGERFESWRQKLTEMDWNCHRVAFTNKMHNENEDCLKLYCGELNYTREDSAMYHEVLNDIHNGPYMPGWNPLRDGIRNVMFKGHWYKQPTAQWMEYTLGNREAFNAWSFTGGPGTEFPPFFGLGGDRTRNPHHPAGYPPEHH